MNAAQALQLSVALTEFQKYIEGRFPPRPAPPGRLAPTGETFVEFAPDARRGDGPRIHVFSTMNEAFSAARIAFDKYAESRSGYVYWRIMPEARLYPDGWRFYMRLLISDKPAKES